MSENPDEIREGTRIAVADMLSNGQLLHDGARSATEAALQSGTLHAAVGEAVTRAIQCGLLTIDQEAEITRLREENGKHAERLYEAQTQVKRLDGHLDRMRKQADGYCAEYNKQRTRADQLQRQYDNSEEAGVKTEEAGEKLQEQIDQLDRQVAWLREERDEARQSLGRRNTQIVEMEETVKKMESTQRLDNEKNAWRALSETSCEHIGCTRFGNHCARCGQCFEEHCDGLSGRKKTEHGAHRVSPGEPPANSTPPSERIGAGGKLEKTTECPECNQEVPVVDGMLVNHDVLEADMRCPNSGKPPTWECPF